MEASLVGILARSVAVAPPPQPDLAWPIFAVGLALAAVIAVALLIAYGAIRASSVITPARPTRSSGQGPGADPTSTPRRRPAPARALAALAMGVLVWVVAGIVLLAFQPPGVSPTELDQGGTGYYLVPYVVAVIAAVVVYRRL